MNPKSSPASMATSRRTRLVDADRIPLEDVLTTLKIGDFQSRWEAAKLLPMFGETAIAPLIELLEEAATEEEWELCWFIARILGEFQHPATIDPLVHLLQSTQDSEIAAVAATALSQLGAIAIAPLTDLLSQPVMRKTAIAALALIRRDEVVPILLSVVDDQQPEVRATAIAALSHFHSPLIRSALLTALKDADVQVRRAAVIGVGSQAKQDDAATLLQALRPLLWDLNLEICSQTAIALSKLGSSEAIALLSQVLHSAQTPDCLRLEIIRALAWTDNLLAVDSLQQFLEQFLDQSQLKEPSKGISPDVGQSDLVQEVIAVLGRVEAPIIQQRAVEILMGLLQTGHPIVQTPRTKQQIALSLGQLGSAEAIDPLIQFLADPELSVRFHAIAALKQLAAQGAYQRLQEAEKNTENSALQTGIATALQEWQVHDQELPQ